MLEREGFLAEGKTASTTTRFPNEIRTFFEDRGSILWITFFGERLGWGFLDALPAQPSDDGRGVWRLVSGGGKHTDINGDALTKERLTGSLTKLAAYRGTSCSVDEDELLVDLVFASCGRRRLGVVGKTQKRSISI
ncbi:MAG: hypothetical protein B7Y80_14235 [Hyphomicrobium sp. 32-62-53]|nr:MAG: hypothetical protein B7Z29_07790 [Hyphomicrobium sp. 12-62-95]OYX98860.1 MAG: hypothetical protein B7Y80_14235 [Hyphomicrobium sp. 32-62-53]